MNIRSNIMGCNQYSDTPSDELRRSCNDNPVPGSMLQTNVLRRTKGGMISCGDYSIALLTFVVLLLLCSCSKSEQDEPLALPSGLNVLWIGTSIPEGCSYPDYSCRSIGANCINKSIGASFLCVYDIGEKGIEYAGLSLTETIREKEKKYGKFVKEDLLSTGRMKRFIDSSYETAVLPYAKWADVIVIDHGYNDDISLYKLYDAKNSVDDTDEQWLSMDRSNYIGAFNYLVAEIRKVNPDVQIVVGGYFQNTCTLGHAVRGKYVQHVTEDLCRHYKLPILDVWNYVDIPDGYKPHSENYLDSINGIYKTDYTKWLPNERGEIPYFQVFCPDKVHPFSDPTGTSDKILNAAVSELFRKRLAEAGVKPSHNGEDF